MIILDSDIFTLLHYKHPNVVHHYEAVPPDERLAVTAITRIEILRGRTDSVLKAANEQELMTATKRLQATEEALNDFLVVHVDEETTKHFRALLGQKKLKMRRPDMLDVLRHAPFAGEASQRGGRYAPDRPAACR